jgi:PPOX class probable F420-dependent enzyme
MEIGAEATRAIADARRGVLVTTGSDGLPRPVPFCYVVSSEPGEQMVLHSAIDDKPKSVSDPLALARVRDIQHRPDVAVLVDRWDEDWSRLGWVRLIGRAAVLLPTDHATAEERAAAAERLRAKYPQYASRALESRPMLRIVVTRAVSWGAFDGRTAPGRSDEDNASSSSPGDSRRR